MQCQTWEIASNLPRMASAYIKNLENELPITVPRQQKSALVDCYSLVSQQQLANQPAYRSTPKQDPQ